MDYASPLFLKDGTKAWICLFTCAVYRAIHFELVTSLSTDSFMEAFRRFIARRGRPSTVYTDNGTNFTGTNRCLQEIDWRKVKEYGSVERIQWIFNPPSAAWWGGWWERLVRSIKELLRKILKRASLNYEELTTILCDCEAIINSRPLTYIAENPHQLIPLSPALFLQDIRGSGVPDIDIVASTEKLNRRMRYRQELRDQLRSRFRIKYLGQLSRRNHKQRPNFQTNVKVGDIVFIGSDQQKRLDWPLGKIIQVFPGQDGKVRVVKLKTATGELVRPVQRLYPLELASESTEVSEEIQNHYKQALNSHKSLPKPKAKQDVPQHPKTHLPENADLDADTSKVPDTDENKEQPERRTRSGRRVITPAKLQQ
ncbi:uncharacterized protein [Temnothorax longispinosus]|uniref:uncharacterized protein n=1 Tax=Temnothorax longispinosus TaxID=300112 RepID=UPI003A9968A1